MKRLLLAILLLIIISTLSAQPAKEAKKPSGYIAVVLKNQAEDYSRRLGDSFSFAASSKGRMAIRIEYCKGNQFKQNSVFEAFIDDKNCKAIILQLIDGRTAPLFAKKAKQCNIPIVFVSKEPNMNLAGYEKLIFYVGSNIEEGGILQGEMIADYWNEHKADVDKNGDGILQYLMIRGELGSNISRIRSESVINTLINKGISLQRIAYGYGDWTDESGSDIILRNISILDDLEMVIANNDEMALGAYKELNKAGYSLPIFSTDATKEGLEALEAGKITGTVISDAKSIADAALSIAYNLILNRPLTEENVGYTLENNIVWIPYMSITREEHQKFVVEHHQFRV